MVLKQRGDISPNPGWKKSRDTKGESILLDPSLSHCLIVSASCLSRRNWRWIADSFEYYFGLVF